MGMQAHQSFFNRLWLQPKRHQHGNHERYHRQPGPAPAARRSEQHGLRHSPLLLLRKPQSTRKASTIGSTPGNIPMASMTTHRITNTIPGMIQRPIWPSSLPRSLQPISPRLSSSTVSDQPNTGFTSADEKITMAADSVVLPLRVICIPASSNGRNTPTISATLSTGGHTARSIG